MSGRHRARYEQVFFDTYGSGPHVCYFCQETASNPVIHHLDHDEENDEPTNLVPAHRPCHNQYHFKCRWVLERRVMMQNRPGRTGMPHTAETKLKISNSKKGQRVSQEAIDQIAEKNRGQKRSDEFRTSASERARNRTPEHQEKLNSANLGKKRSPEARDRMRQSALARHAKRRAREAGGTGDGGSSDIEQRD